MVHSMSIVYCIVHNVKSHWYLTHETYTAKWQIMFKWDHTHQSHSSCSSSRITFIQCNVIWFLVALRYFVLYFTVCNLFFRNNEIGIFVHYLYKDTELILNSVVVIFSSSSLMEECCMNVQVFFPHHIFLVSSGMYYVNSVGFSVKVLKP